MVTIAAMVSHTQAARDPVYEVGLVIFAMAPHGGLFMEDAGGHWSAMQDCWERKELPLLPTCDRDSDGRKLWSVDTALQMSLTSMQCTHH